VFGKECKILSCIKNKLLTRRTRKCSTAGKAMREYSLRWNWLIIAHTEVDDDDDDVDDVMNRCEI
jgi:hypothetical protein